MQHVTRSPVQTCKAQRPGGLCICMAVAWLCWGATWCSAFWPIAGRLSSEASQYSELTCTRTLSQTTLLHAHSSTYTTVTAPNAPDMPCTKGQHRHGEAQHFTVTLVAMWQHTFVHTAATCAALVQARCHHGLHTGESGMCCTCSMGCTPLCGPRTARSPAGQGHRQCCA